MVVGEPGVLTSFDVGTSKRTFQNEHFVEKIDKQFHSGNRYLEKSASTE
jgi:hypothetical protein